MAFGATFKDEAAAGTRKGAEFRRIMSYYDRKAFLFMSFFFAAVAGASPLLITLPLKKATEIFGGIGPGFLDLVADFCKEAAWVMAVCIVLQTWSAALQAIVAPQFLVDIRKRLYKNLMDADIEYFDETSCGALISRISEGVTYIKDVYIDTLFTTILACALSIGGIIESFCFNWKITLYFIPFPIALGVQMYAGVKWANKVWDRYHSAGTESVEKAVSVITEFRTVKSFDQELWEAEDFRSNLYAEDNILKRVSFIRAGTFSLALCILGAMVLTIVWYNFDQMVNHQENGLDFYHACIVMNGLVMFALGIHTNLSISDDFEMAKICARNVAGIIEMKPKINRHEGKDVGALSGEIEFRDVGFRYKGCEQWAVRHLSFKIKAGETVAFVGESGCGKSTTLQLIQRFYDIEEGEILFDGIDIKEISPICLRKNISIVPQGPVLFSMTISDNIAYSKKDATADEIAEAAVTGNAHNFIMELDDNYKTMVHQTSLSGGQKQRICISRAILQPTPILLLDEATAALDTESEQLVQESLESFRHGKTSIMVAHRLATVVHADRILVFQDGKIVEEGTHKELLERNGIYADLAKFQLQ